MTVKMKVWRFHFASKSWVSEEGRTLAEAKRKAWVKRGEKPIGWERLA